MNRRWVVVVIVALAALLIPTDARVQAPYLIFNHPTDCANPDGDDLGDSGSDSDSRSDIGPTSANIWICVYEATTFTFHGESSACGKSHAYGDIELYNAATANVIESYATYDTWDIGACMCDNEGIIVDRTLGAGYYRLHANADAGYSLSCDGGSLSSVAAETCQSFCTDGTEILAARTPLYAGDAWTGSGSGYSNQRVRFTYFVPSDSSAALLGEINGGSDTINASGAVSQSTVIPSEAVSGPTANITLTHQSGARTDLLSVCLLDAGGSGPDPTSTPCENCRFEVRQYLPEAQDLQPLPFCISESKLSIDIEASEMWFMGRVALTLYSLIGDNTWLTLLFLLLIPVIIGVIYQLFLSPPDI